MIRLIRTIASELTCIYSPRVADSMVDAALTIIRLMIFWEVLCCLAVAAVLMDLFVVLFDNRTCFAVCGMISFAVHAFWSSWLIARGSLALSMFMIFGAFHTPEWTRALRCGVSEGLAVVTLCYALAGSVKVLPVDDEVQQSLCFMLHVAEIDEW